MPRFAKFDRAFGPGDEAEIDGTPVASWAGGSQQFPDQLPSLNVLRRSPANGETPSDIQHREEVRARDEIPWSAFWDWVAQKRLELWVDVNGTYHLRSLDRKAKPRMPHRTFA